MKYNVVKKNHGRRRFLKSRNPISISSWTKEAHHLLNFLEQKTHLQRVGSDFFFMFKEGSGTTHLMIEVLGLPFNADSISPVLFDLDAQFFYCHTPEQSIFDSKIEDIFSLKDRLLSLLCKNAEGELYIKDFIIVLNDDKIELQFFKQNDYSQNQL